MDGWQGPSSSAHPRQPGLRGIARALAGVGLLYLVPGVAFVSQTDTFLQQMRQLTEAWREAYNAQDADRLASLYTDDVRSIGPFARNDGRESMRRQFARDLRGGAHMDSLTTDFVEHSGDLGYITGGWAGSFPPPGGGAAVRMAGRYVTIVRNVHGRWLIAADATTLAPPP